MTSTMQSGSSHPILDSAVAASGESPTIQNGGLFEHDAALVLGRLQLALDELLGAVPVRPRSAAQVSKAFGLDKALGWNIFRMTVAPSPLAVGLHVPAPVSVKRLLTAATKHSVPMDVVVRVADAFTDFERLALRHADDRDELDALIISALPEEREKAMRQRREALYTAARDIRGVSLKTGLFLAILYPNRENPSLIDGARVIAWLDLRRIHRGAVMRARSFRDLLREDAPKTLDGLPVRSLTDVILQDFTSKPLPRMTATTYGPNAEHLKYTLEPGNVGLRSSINVVFADLMQGYCRRTFTPDRSRIGGSIGSQYPRQRQILDVLVCDGLVEPQQPQVKVYDTSESGFVEGLENPNRTDDLVDFAPSVRYMGRGPHQFSTPHVPKYGDIVEHVCGRRGWDSSRLHGYRMEVEYPLFTWQFQMTLRLPETAREPSRD
jgi:hypothetical protein